MTDRFDLEQQIFDCWHIVDELKTLGEAVCESDLTADETANVLIGLERLYSLKFDRMFRTFETCIKGGVFDVEEPAT